MKRSSAEKHATCTLGNGPGASLERVEKTKLLSWEFWSATERCVPALFRIAKGKQVQAEVKKHVEAEYIPNLRHLEYHGQCEF